MSILVIFADKIASTPNARLIESNFSVISHIPCLTNPQYPLKIDPESINGIVNAVPSS